MTTKGRILIVDDIPTNVDILRRILRKDYDLDTAASGEECLAKLPIFKPELVLLDIMMPGIDGYETCRRVKSSDLGEFIQVILVSGKGSPAERLQGYESQADDYIVKPFNHEELSSKVRVHFRLGNTQRQLSLAKEQLQVYAHDLEQLVEQRTRQWAKMKEMVDVRTAELTTANQELHNEVSQRRNAEEALTQQAVDLQQANTAALAALQAKSDFLANMSHEIRTPMTAILGYVDIMLEESIGPAAREYAEVIKRNGAHLLGLINDILDLSKVESGKLQIEPTRCSPLQVAAEVVSLMRVRAEAKKLDLRADLVGPLPETVLTDPLRLRQVLVNLVGNAIKFTDQGDVCLAVRLTSDSGRPLLCFDVSDTGIGISEEQVKKLFQPFTQVDNSSTRKFGGTGLGLCISKRLTETLGGSIEVRSTPGKGSTFRVTIDPGPLDGIRMNHDAQEALRDPTPATTVATPVTTEFYGRVLLAEDGPDNQRLIRFLLKKAGADIMVVENGQLAVEQACIAWEQGQPFDVILMDMQMPVMDGYLATRQLRKRGYCGPIIAMTAHAMAEDRQKCLDAGCDDYATKPIDRQRLLTTVARWVARASIDRPTSQSTNCAGRLGG